ncbi:MAG: fused MFS/spermidine synthase [Candidatus Lindowbacteria bacterium]|nr:fused MFS/spermidine synthase [Candidatus Lindowbacteria bacterium]
MLFPTFLMGAAFPVVVQICVQSMERVGDSIGKLYSINTLGCILGSFASGFVLIPLLGVSKSILILGCVNAAAGVILFYAHPSLSLARKGLMTAVMIPVLAFLGLSASKFADVHFTSPLENVGRTLYYKEGIGATVKVFENKTSGIQEISIDGYPVACSGNTWNWRGPEVQQALAHFPMLLHPNPKDICIVGFGAGGTSYNVSLYDVRDITCVELSPEVPKAAPFLAEVNHNVLANPKFDLVIEDGRNYILRTGKRFDVITVDATSPKFAGNVSLYTKEFYDMCREKLTPGGVMALWAPYHLLSRREDLMLFNTFKQSFPHFSVWFTSNRGYFVLIGSNEPIRIDFHNVERQMSKPEIRRELAAVELNTPYELLACYVMGEDAPDELFEGIPINTDDHPYIEYFEDDGEGLGEFIFDGRIGEPDVYHFADTDEVAAQKASEYKRFMEASNHLISAHYWWRKGYLGEAITRIHLALMADPVNREALVLDRVLEDKFKTLYWARATAAYQKKDVNEALRACANILRILPNDPDTRAVHSERFLAPGQPICAPPMRADLSTLRHMDSESSGDRPQCP